MKFLNTLLGPTSLPDFLEQSFTKVPYSAPLSAQEHVSLLDWSVLERIFSEKKSVLRIVKDGVYFKDQAEYSFAEAQELFRKGHTILVRFAEKSDTALAELAREFQEFFKNVVDIQLYCTPDGSNAFGWHYDVEEVFILQTKGSKEYTIRHNTVHPNPLVSSIPKNLQFEQEKSSLTMKVVLKAGDFLYIPSGWWHKAETKEESMHVSIGVMPSSALKIIDALPTYLSQSPFWRTRMPLHREFASNEEAQAFYQDAFRALGTDLAKKLSDPAFVQHFIDHISKPTTG